MKNRLKAAPEQRSDLLLLGLVTLSGALGLSYEVLWARVLALCAGHTLGAMSTVAATFMGGLALGSVLAERPWVRGLPPLAAYGAAEVGIAAYALVLPWLLPLIDPLADLAYRASGSSPAMAVALQLGWAALLLLPPTTLMGATTPLLVRARLGREDSAARLAWVYGVNSMGGALGALGVTFVLLPALGHAATGWCLAATGALVGAVALRTGRDAATSEQEAKPFKIARSALAIAAVSGAVGMALEVAWTRALILFLGSSTYAFSMILAVFIFGLSLGSHLAGFAMRRRFDARRAVGGLLVALGVAALGSLALVGYVPGWTSELLASAGDSFAQVCVVQLGLVALVTLPSTLALGAILPLCARIEGDAGSTGHLYGFNTGGAVAGSLAATFVGIPFAGLAGTIAAAALAPLALGGAHLASRRRGAVAVGLAACGLAVALLLPAWDHAVLDSGPFVLGRSMAPGASGDYTAQAQDMGKILFHKEGPCVTVAVRESGQRCRTLVVNGKPDASTLLDMKTQRLVAHLPLSLHPDPQEVLVIGLGSGVTAGAVLRHPVRRSTVVELSPEVVEASRYFNQESGAPLTDPRTRLVLADGRTHLFRTDDVYDVIISEPTNPWIAGVSSLFTREYFTRCRDRLGARGVMSQWIQAYSLPPEDFMSILHTFRTVFPNATLWKAVSGADYLLVGSKDGGPLDHANMKRSFAYAGVRRECTDVEVRDEVDMLAHYICGPKGLDALDAGARMQVDDRLDLEFSAPRHVGMGASDTLMAVVAHLTESPLAAVAPRLTTAELREIELRRQRYDAYELLRIGDLKSAVEILTAIETTCRDERIPASFLKGFYLAATNMMQDTGSLEKAQDVLERLTERFPTDIEYAAAMATLSVRKGDIADGRARYLRILERNPDETNAHRGMAVLDEAHGDLKSALAHYEALARVNPSDALARGSIVRVLRAMDQHPQAEQALQLALATDPGIASGPLLAPIPAAPDR